MPVLDDSMAIPIGARDTAFVALFQIRPPKEPRPACTSFAHAASVTARRDTAPTRHRHSAPWRSIATWQGMSMDVDAPGPRSRACARRAIRARWMATIIVLDAGPGGGGLAVPEQLVAPPAQYSTGFVPAPIPAPSADAWRCRQFSGDGAVRRAYQLERHHQHQLPAARLHADRRDPMASVQRVGLAGDSGRWQRVADRGPIGTRADRGYRRPHHHYRLHLGGSHSGRAAAGRDGAARGGWGHGVGARRQAGVVVRGEQQRRERWRRDQPALQLVQRCRRPRPLRPPQLITNAWTDSWPEN